MREIATRATVVGSMSAPPKTHSSTVRTPRPPIRRSSRVTGPIRSSSPAAQSGTSRPPATSGG